MQFLIADECSLTWDAKVGYFMYGGIVVDETEVRPLSVRLLELKEAHGIEKERPIKWNNKSWGGTTLDEGLHRNIKDDVLTAFAASSAKIIVCMSPHQFYHNPTIKNDGELTMSIDPGTQLRTHEYGLNDLLAKFNRLVGEGNFGMVLADRFGDAVKSHMDAHCKNLFPNGTRYIYPNIAYPVIQVENDDSYLHQINDVVLGAIYVSLREMGHNFLPRIKDNFWAVRDIAGGQNIDGNGFTIYPLRQQYDWCREANANLQAKFNRLINQV